MENVTIITDVSIIIPIHNGEPWLNDCFKSIESQQDVNNLCIEISVFNDASSDATSYLLEEWSQKIKLLKNFSIKISSNEGKKPKGVGYAKNAAVKQSSGTYLCFQDIDDIMLPNRINGQYHAANQHSNCIIGSQFTRLPTDSTIRFTRWANNLKEGQLYTQIYTSHGPTLIMPTWFFSREVYERVGGFSESGSGTPEDLLFFYDHIDRGGKLFRVDEYLLIYRYHPNATTFSIDRWTIWNIQVKRLQEKVLLHWVHFTIWNAGKQGRQLYRSLEPQFRVKVKAFCDVDPNKIGKNYVPYEKSKKSQNAIPIIHYKEASPPLVICVKLDLTGGIFENNLQSLNLHEGSDFIIFS